jgi:CPA1 family monovalent cation:H+ antiporter
MTLVETLTVLICLSANFSYLNHLYLHLPTTIGLMAIALATSMMWLLIGKLRYGIEANAVHCVRGIDCVYDEMPNRHLVPSP